MNNIEVCFSPQLYPLHDSENRIVVVVDILRATSVICTMFHNNVKKVIPVKTIDDARKHKDNGSIIVAERDGKKLDFADFGNSPFYFTKDIVENKELVYSTTNGTNAITIGKNAKEVVIASFINLSAISEYIISKNEDILILCAGWKGKFCLEDSVFAGALIEKLLESGNYSTICDSANASIDFWKLAKPNLMGYIQKVAQRERLRKLGLDDVIEYCHNIDLSKVIPVLENDYLIDISKK